MSGNDALGKAPTFEEQTAKFMGFSVKDGEVDSGKPTEEEEAAALANSSSHAQNLARGAEKEAKGDKGEKEAKATTLTTAEADAAIAAAEEANGGEELTEEESDAAVAAALAEKTAAANKAPHKNSAERRISQLTRTARQAQRDAQTARDESALLRRQLLEKGANKDAPLTQDAKGERPITPGKPDPSDAEKYQYGELDAKYIADLTRWTVKDAQAESKWEEKGTVASASDEAAATVFKERVSAFEEAGLEEFGEDFQSVIDSYSLPKDDPDYWPLSADLGELIMESEVGPAIAKELASDPKEARRINKMSPLRQAAWFGVKEEKILAGSGANDDESEEGDAAAARQTVRKKPAIKESKAPLPLKNSKLNGAGGNRVPNEATTDFAAFEAMATGQRKT